MNKDSLSKTMSIIPLRISKQYREIYTLQPNQLGNDRINTFYKRTTHFLKKSPFIVIVPLVVLTVILIYVLIGPYLVKLASLLQYGF